MLEHGRRRRRRVTDIADPDCTGPLDASESGTSGTPTPPSSTTTTTPEQPTTTSPETTTTSPETTTEEPETGSTGPGGAVGPTGDGGRGVGGLTDSGESKPGRDRDRDRDRDGGGNNGGTRAPMNPEADRNPDGSPTDTNPSVTIADFGAAPIGVPNFVIDQFTIPPFLLPIYQACGTQYGIPWQVLASINRIETAFGTNLNVSTAGALGWMQFMPATWEMYGVDANNDGRKDPYNPVDAICAAARYLNAAGGRRGPAHRDLRLQPRRLVRRRGPALREPVRQAPRDPGQLAHRAHRGRPLPGRRQRPLRRRHLRAPRARALEARQGGPARQRRRGDLKLDHTSRDQHLRPRGRAGGRGQRRRRHRDRQVEEARPLHRPPGRLRQPLHLRRARRGLRGLPGAEGEQALGQGLRAGHPRRRGARPSRRPPAARSTTSGPPRARPATTRPPRSPTSASGPPPQEPTRSPARSTPRTPASASTPTRSAATTRPAPGSPASSTSCSRRGCPATSSSRAISPT